MADNSKNPNEKKEFFFGEEVSGIIERAEDGSLNHDIEMRLNALLGNVAETVGKTMDTVNQELGKTMENVERERSNYSRYQGSYTHRSSNYQRTGNQRSSSGQNTNQRRFSAVNRAPICKPPKDGLALRIFGWLGTGLFGFIEALFVFMTVALWDADGLAVSLMMFPFLAGSLALLGGGIAKKNRLNRYIKYVAELQGKNYASIKDLARATGKSETYTLKDIKKMIAEGVFPTGYLDDEETYLMVTRDVYEDYRRMERSKKERETAQRQMIENEKLTAMEKEMAERAAAEKAKRMTEVEKTVAEGRSALREIDVANQALPEEAITNKLNRLHDVVERILFCVERQPEKLEDIRQFMKYYLPTTLKLVKAYQGFEENPIQGKNIQTAKEEIELSLDTINDGFERLLNNLFEQDAMDVSSDIYVLQSMLAREGLTKDPFEDLQQGQSSMDMPDPFGDVRLEEGRVVTGNE